MLNLFDLSLGMLKVHFTLMWWLLSLFILGFVFSGVVEKLSLKVLTWFPKWFMANFLKFASPKKPFIQIMLFIFLFNSISVLIYMLSGVLFFLPLLIVFLTGLNIGIAAQLAVQQESEAEPSLKILFYGPLVMCIEIFIFCFALAMGITLGFRLYGHWEWARFLALLQPRITVYLGVCVPLLLLSAYLETSSIKETGK